MRCIAEIRENIVGTLSPIVVKELRQAIKSRFLETGLLFLLCVQLLIIGIFLFTHSATWSFVAGRSLFSTLVCVLLGTCLLLIPAYTGIRLAIECSGSSINVLFNTTLRAWSIIWGKFLAALFLAVLLYSACVPFLTFICFMSGVDVPSLFVLMVLNFLVAAVSVQCALLIGCISSNWLLKTGIGFVWIVSMATAVFLFFKMMILPGGVLDSGVGSQFGSTSFWTVALFVVVSASVLIGLLGFLATAAISPLPANRALPVRLYVAVIWFITGLAAGICGVALESFTLIEAWACFHFLLYSVGFFVSVCERERLGRRVLRSIPRRWFPRPISFLFYSGSAGGVAWCSVMSFLTLFCVMQWYGIFYRLSIYDDFNHLTGQSLTTIMASVSGLVGSGGFPHKLSAKAHVDFISIALLSVPFAYSYALGASMMRRHFLSQRISAAYTWVIALILVFISTAIIPVILFLIFGNWETGWFIGSPVSLLLWLLDGDTGILDASAALAIPCAMMLSVLDRTWFLKQYNSFWPLYEKTQVDRRHMNSCTAVGSS
ncbi:MAG: hypothetical protein OXN17_12660 [Candidatus Poribacteria bacterium]|nr:hypothetical protein [Candidatus Poribacteria bacterium]MDE0502920.1 hypothetical protein [Candidatus Poribacteria bacterium]